MFSRFLNDYGMLLVLVLVCGFFSIVTYEEQAPTGSSAGIGIAQKVIEQTEPGAGVLIVTRATPDDRALALALEEKLSEAGRTILGSVQGDPADVRKAILALAAKERKVDALVTTQETARWPVLDGLESQSPGLKRFVPETYYWPNFLMPGNLLNIPDQISVIAIMAIGMTLVIITGGIDLSVGSIAALAAVTSTLLIRDLAGGTLATPIGMCLCCGLAIAISGLLGLVNGSLVAFAKMPSFIATLGMLLISRSFARWLSGGESIFQIPADFTWLSRGSMLGGVPNVVCLMATLYLLAQSVIRRTTLGRHIYAVGGNPEAARLAGVSVSRTLLIVYGLSGILAGLGGVLLASLHESGNANYAKDYELYVIASVVVGGTRITGGEGQVLGTLIGAFLIAVINNGMNLIKLDSDIQPMVMGSIIIGAVLLDRIKHRYWLGRTD